MAPLKGAGWRLNVSLSATQVILAAWTRCLAAEANAFAKKMKTHSRPKQNAITGINHGYGRLALLRYLVNTLQHGVQAVTACRR